MEQLKIFLEKRKQQLAQLQKEKEKALQSAPEGTLRISGHEDKIQYYHRQNSRNNNGIYLKEKDIKIARALAQKDYDQKVLQTVEKELKAITRFQLNYPEPNAEEIYGELHKERQKLVRPIREPDEEYIRRWEGMEYIGKPIDETIAELYTAKGERVRSKSEVIIADTLNREGIPYHYEYPIQLKGYGKVYPDFTILNIRLRKEMHWEHLGRMDDEEYAEKAIRKINNYIQNGIFPGENLILTYETKKIQLNQKLIKLMINQYLK